MCACNDVNPQRRGRPALSILRVGEALVHFQTKGEITPNPNYWLWVSRQAGSTGKVLKLWNSGAIA